MSLFSISTAADEPPPPYSAVAPPGQVNSQRIATSTSSAYSQELNLSHNSYQGSVSPTESTTATPRYVPMAVATVGPSGSSELERSDFISALPYFELRSCNRPRPVDTSYHHLIIDPHARPHNLPFPEPNE